MKKDGYYLVLWRVDDIPYHKKDKNLFNELHNPKILSLAEVVGAVELQTSQRPGKILDDWKPEIIRLLGGVGSISGLAGIGKLEEETALTKALVEQKDDYSTISISAFTILLKSAVGGWPERFTRKVYRELQARSLPTLLSFAEYIETVERGRSDAERPYLLFNDGGEDRTETAERAAGCDIQEIKPTAEDEKKLKEMIDLLKGSKGKVDKAFFTKADTRKRSSKKRGYHRSVEIMTDEGVKVFQFGFTKRRVYFIQDYSSHYYDYHQ